MDFLSWIRAQYDRVGAVVAVVAGAVALLLGWLGASNTPYPPEQIPYLISGAALGIFLLGLGATLWLSADLRDEWRKLDRLEHGVAGASTSNNGRGAPAAPKHVAEKSKGSEDHSSTPNANAPKRSRRRRLVRP